MVPLSPLTLILFRAYVCLAHTYTREKRKERQILIVEFESACNVERGVCDVFLLLFVMEGVLDWTTGATFSADDSSASLVEHPRLISELTPTVLTGWKESTEGRGPLAVYVRLSSVTAIERVTSRALRLRTGRAGGAITLTAPSPAACKQWGDALASLTGLPVVIVVPPSPPRHEAPHPSSTPQSNVALDAEPSPPTSRPPLRVPSPTSSRRPVMAPAVGDEMPATRDSLTASATSSSTPVMAPSAPTPQVTLGGHFFAQGPRQPPHDSGARDLNAPSTPPGRVGWDSTALEESRAEESRPSQGPSAAVDAVHTQMISPPRALVLPSAPPRRGVIAAPLEAVASLGDAQSAMPPSTPQRQVSLPQLRPFRTPTTPPRVRSSEIDLSFEHDVMQKLDAVTGQLAATAGPVHSAVTESPTQGTQVSARLDDRPAQREAPRQLGVRVPGDNVNSSVISVPTLSRSHYSSAQHTPNHRNEDWRLAVVDGRNELALASVAPKESSFANTYAPIAVVSTVVPRARSSSAGVLALSRWRPWASSPTLLADPFNPFTGGGRMGRVRSQSVPLRFSRTATMDNERHTPTRRLRRGPEAEQLCKPRVFIKHAVQSAGAMGSRPPVSSYVFVTLDLAHVVCVTVADYEAAVREARLMGHCHGGADAMPVLGVRSLDSAMGFFGDAACRALPVGSVERVTLGTEEPYLRTGSLRPRRFPSREFLVCIIGITHGFFLEARSHREAQQYARLWQRAL